jgi:hypothetical protein
VVEIIHGGDEAILELLLGGDANVPQDGTGEFREEALDEIEPRAVIGGESEFEAVHRLIGKPGFGFPRDMCRMIVEDQLDRRACRIGGVEKLEEFDEFPAAMAILDQRMDLAGDEVEGRDRWLSAKGGRGRGRRRVVEEPSAALRL